MRFKVEHQGQQVEVRFSTVTECRIVKPDGSELAYDIVSLNHRDAYDPVIGQRESLKKALRVLEKPEDRLPFWERWVQLAIDAPRQQFVQVEATSRFVRIDALWKRLKPIAWKDTVDTPAKVLVVPQKSSAASR